MKILRCLTLSIVLALVVAGPAFSEIITVAVGENAVVPVTGTGILHYDTTSAVAIKAQHPVGYESACTMVQVHGDMAYLGYEGGIIKINLKTGEQLNRSLSGVVYDIGISAGGTHLFAARGHFFEVLTVEDISTDSSTLLNAERIFVDGNYVYMASGNEVCKIDVSDPVHFEVIATCNINIDSPWDIHANENRIFVPNNQGIYVFDKITMEFLESESLQDHNRYFSVAIDSDRKLLFATTDGLLKVFNLETMTIDDEEDGLLTMKHPIVDSHLDHENRRLYLVSADGLLEIDLSVYPSALSFSAMVDLPETSEGMFVKDGVAYVTNNSWQPTDESVGLQVVDLNLISREAVNFYPQFTKKKEWVTHLKAGNDGEDRIWMPWRSEGEHEVHMIDDSGLYPLSYYFPYFDKRMTNAVWTGINSQWIVATWFDDNSFDNGGIVITKGRGGDSYVYETGFYPQDLDIIPNGNKVYLANGLLGVIPVDITNAAAAVIGESIGPEGFLQAIKLYGDYIFAVTAGSERKLYVGKNDAWITNVGLSANIWGIETAGNFLFLTHEGGMFIFDISDPENPVFVDDIDTLGADNGIARTTGLSGDKIWQTAGWYIYNMPTPQILEPSGGNITILGTSLQKLGNYILKAGDQETVIRVVDSAGAADVNCDGEIDLLDAVASLQIATGIPVNGICLLGDIGNNGINQVEAIAALRIAAGL